MGSYYVSEEIIDLKIANAIAANPGGSSYLVAEKEITNDEILDLAITYIKVIDSPGSGKLIMINQAVMYWDVAAGAYGNVSGGGGIMLVYASNWLANASNLAEQPSATTNRVQMLIQWVGDSNAGQGVESESIEEGDCVNQGIYVALNTAGGNLTNGNAANSLKIKVWYQIVNIPMF